jgi:hypothetical protein
MEPELRRHRAHVARRLHHPQRFLGKIKEAYDNNPKLTKPAAGRLFPRRNQAAQKGWRNVVATAAKKGHSRSPPSARRWPSTTSIVPRFCRRICCRRNGIISARTLTSAWTSRAANFSTPTGPAKAARRAAALTTYNRHGKT